MKQVLVLILSMLSVTETSHKTSLYLPNATPGFKEQILDAAIQDLNEKQSFILVRIKTNENHLGQYKFTVFTLLPKELRRFYLPSDNYRGYFVYKQRIVLVYGDDAVSVFFKRTNSRKHFSFLSAPKPDLENSPPISIEPVTYNYIFNDGKWKVTH